MKIKITNIWVGRLTYFSFITASTFLWGCGQEEVPVLKPKSTTLAPIATPPVPAVPKKIIITKTDKPDNPLTIPLPTLTPNDNDNRSIANSTNGDNSEEANTQRQGRELSAQASEAENNASEEAEKKGGDNSAGLSNAIPKNKPMGSKIDSLKDMSKEVSDKVGDLLKKKPLNFTQCFHSFAEGEFRRKLEFYEDQERKCWGQAWAVPKQYLYNIREEPNEDVLVLRFDVKTLKSDEDTKSLINDTTLLVVSPSDGFSQKRSTMKRKISSVSSVFENQREMFHMDLYEPARWQNEFRSVFFFNEDNKDFYARCLLSANDKIDDSPADLKCDVYSHVDNRVDIDYKIKFSDMGKIYDINAQVQQFLKGFMRKSGKK